MSCLRRGNLHYCKRSQDHREKKLLELQVIDNGIKLTLATRKMMRKLL